MRFACLNVVSMAIVLSGCAGKIDYVQPTKMASTPNTVTINKSKDEVWDAAVPKLGKNFYVINNLDKSSGLINISYSGDPESYIDCGKITSYVKNARGERTYDFPGAKSQQTYEIMNNSGLFLVDRKMNLEGRVNLIFEEIAPRSTQVTANVKYVVTKNITAQNLANNIPIALNDSVSFNSGGSASFPATADGRATECVPTGKLEEEILTVVQ